MAQKNCSITPLMPRFSNQLPISNGQENKIAECEWPRNKILCSYPFFFRLIQDSVQYCVYTSGILTIIVKCVGCEKKCLILSKKKTNAISNAATINQQKTAIPLKKSALPSSLNDWRSVYIAIQIQAAIRNSYNGR